MSIKDILVALGPGRADDAAKKYALSMAAKLRAHVTACVYALEPELRGVDWLPEEIIKSHRSSLLQEAKAAVKKFQEDAKEAKLNVTSELFRANLSEATKNFSETARVHDIAVLTQSRRGLEYVGDVFLEAALFFSGRPVVIVPRDYDEAFSTSRVLIAWDGSLHATRAVALSMSLLAPSSDLKVVVVGDRTKAQATRAKELVKNLAHHGYEAELLICDDDDALTIAREAKSWEASLLVMGGYGRSKLRETVFGGVTRHMLLEAPLPILMAH